MKKVGIDGGHGGYDPGGTGPMESKESTNVLEISKKVGYYLENAGIEVIYTRTDDSFVSLTERCNIINNTRCDLAISIHNNASANPEPNYNSVFIQGTGGRAEKLANAINNQLIDKMAWPNAGVKVINLQINRNTNCPSCLVECGFISNPYEEKRLQDDDIRDMFARAIAIGITDYLTSI